MLKETYITRHIVGDIELEIHDIKVAVPGYICWYGAPSEYKRKNLTLVEELSNLKTPYDSKQTIKFPVAIPASISTMPSLLESLGSFVASIFHAIMAFLGSIIAAFQLILGMIYQAFEGLIKFLLSKRLFCW